MAKKQEKSKGEQTKDKIIKASIKLFSKKGYDGTSVQDIADVCGLSQTNIFYHFGSKRKLFEFTVHKVIQHNREMIKAKTSGKETTLELLTKFINGNVEWAYNYSNEFQIIMLLLYFSTSSSHLKNLSGQIFENAVTVLAEWIEELKQEGACTSKLSSFDLARMIQQYINGVQYQVVSRNDSQFIMENYKKNLTHFLKIILNMNGDLR